MIRLKQQNITLQPNEEIKLNVPRGTYKISFGNADTASSTFFTIDNAIFDQATILSNKGGVEIYNTMHPNFALSKEEIVIKNVTASAGSFVIDMYINQ